MPSAQSWCVKSDPPLLVIVRPFPRDCLWLQELQGGETHNETAAVDGDACLPADHPTGGETWAVDSGPCTTGEFLHMDALGLVGNIDSTAGYPVGVDCRWSLSCPAGSGPVVSFLGADGLLLNPHSLGP